MTLIIKELIIQGVVKKDSNQDETEILLENKYLLFKLDQMKKEIKEECMEAILSKLESKSRR